MELDALTARCAVLAVVFSALGAAAIFYRVRAGRFLSGMTGVHMNVLMLFGLGLGAYLLEPPGSGAGTGMTGRDHNFVRILAAIWRAAPPLVLGYAVVVAWDIRLQRRTAPADGALAPPVVSLPLLAALALVSAAGYVGGRNFDGTSGAGTLLPVLTNLLFPATVLAVWTARAERPLSVLLAVALVAFAGVTGILVQVRSQLVFAGLSVAIGLALRQPRRPLLPLVAMAVALLALLPFAQQKKLHFDEVSRDPASAFVRSLDMSLGDRLVFVTRFWAVRIDAARELGFVADAIDSGRIPLRHGVSYWEAVQQLVPRALWPDKPSFNTKMNVELARDIGLIAKTNRTTAWGVNVFAEALWNFGALALLVFVPLFCVGVGAVDELFARSIRHPTLRAVLGGALMFQFFGGASLVQVVTYLLWTFLLGVAADRALRPPAIPVPA